jgi:hypothetical protein
MVRVVSVCLVAAPVAPASADGVAIGNTAVVGMGGAAVALAMGSWEPGRFDNVSGRVHGTFGAEVRVGEVFVWGYRRGRIGITGDVAARYCNVGLSIGLWH